MSVFLCKFADAKKRKMKLKITSYILIITIFAVFSCNSPSPKQPTIGNPDADTLLVDDDASTSSSLVMDADEETVSTQSDEQQPTDAQPSEPKQSKAAKAKTPSTSTGGKETLYISTYGANGKVWGHVTMNGNKGRGTIHDDDENSYSITVTRHGGELHGVDQNGRGYVFRM